MELKNVRTRFAPSPTGMLHLGNANTALFNWLVARRYGGAVVLRIEDTDAERSTGDFERGIIEDLKWLGIDWNEGPDKGGDFGPYRQMDRSETYSAYLSKLFDLGAVYKCYCTREELDRDREAARKEKRAIHYSGRCRDLSPQDREKFESEGRPFSVRFRTPQGERVHVGDLIRGDIAFDTAELDDFIIVRSNGVPVFLFSNAIDDALMAITHVVRGEDHISNTPKQVLVNNALGLDTPAYLHIPIILGPDRTKLSKRHGAVSVGQFRDQGILPEALVNYLAFLGWNPKDDSEFFSMDELREKFTIEGMSRSPSVFDYSRLKYINAHWMQNAGRGRVADIAIDYMVSSGWITPAEAKTNRDWLEKIVEVVGDRMKTVEDLDVNAGFFFRDIGEYEEKGAKKHFKGEETAGTLELLARELEKVENFDSESIETMMRALVEEHNISGKKIIHPTRLALTGATVGPGLFELMEILGKEKCIERLGRAAALNRELAT